nr:tRNA-guanine transglycosylase [Allobaculum sp. Allo2]
METKDTTQQSFPNRFSFEILERIPGHLGRAGIIHTPHGDIHTPAFMCVGTHGEVRYVSMEQLKEICAQAMLSNGYHLRGRSQEIADAGGLAKWSGWNSPTLTDSGGFQVMSLGSGIGKVVSMDRERKSSTRRKRSVWLLSWKTAFSSTIHSPIRMTLSVRKNPWKFSAGSVRTFIWRLMN